jgi:hypothetical protein
MIAAASPHNGKSLPQFVRDLLSAPPRRGGGLHNWLFRTARVLHPFRSREEIIDLLRAATSGEQVKSGEIESAVNSSADCAWIPGAKSMPVKKTSPWPALDEAKRGSIIADGAGLADLWELSPSPRMDADSKTEAIIDELFPGDSLLCCGASSKSFSTRPRSEWRGKLAGLQLIVPSPMSAVKGKTQDGRESQHTLSNTGPRRFLVIEQDSGTPDEQASLMVHLAKIAPLVLAVHSGSKSIHGWFYCAGRVEEQLRRFMNYAVSLGADRATWTRSQFVRMPDGTRDNGKRQAVYFFNPEVLKNER